MAVCEETTAIRTVVAQEPISADPTPETWARLGGVLMQSGEIVEAQ